jgi:hypothetical protein
MDFFDEGIHVGRNRIFLTGVGVEVAVGAAVFAKGDVEVDGSVGHVRLIIKASGAGNKSLFGFVCENHNLSIDMSNIYFKFEMT